MPDVLPSLMGLADRIKSFGSSAASTAVETVRPYLPAAIMPAAPPAPVRKPLTRAQQQSNLWPALSKYNPLTIPDEIFSEDNTVPGYRADPKRKYGGKDGLETKSVFLRGPNMYGIARGAAIAAKKHGLPMPNADTLASMALQEGRDDFGLNYDYQESSNPKVAQLEKSLKSSGLDDFTARFVTTYADKVKTAQRLGISVPEAWNGTGMSEYGKTGSDYAQSLEFNRQALRSPKNQKLVKLIQKGLFDGGHY